MQRKECHLLICHPKAILISLEVSQTGSSKVWYCLGQKWQARSLEWWGYRSMSCRVDSEELKDWLQNIFIQFKILSIVGLKTFKLIISSGFHIFLLTSYRETCGQWGIDFFVLRNFLVWNYFWTLLRVENMSNKSHFVIVEVALMYMTFSSFCLVRKLASFLLPVTLSKKTA